MIVLMNAYTGHMKAMMMVKPEPIRINSMAELALHEIPVYVWRGTAYEALLRVRAENMTETSILPRAAQSDPALIRSGRELPRFSKTARKSGRRNFQTSPVPEYARVYALVQKCNGAKSTDDLYKEEILHQVSVCTHEKLTRRSPQE